MKWLAVTFVVFITLALIGCGSSSSNSSNIDGNWNATLISGGNQTVFTFGTSLKVNGDGSLSVSNFSFTHQLTMFRIGRDRERFLHTQRKLQWNGEWEIRFHRAVRIARRQYACALRHSERQHDLRNVDVDRNRRLHRERHLHHDKSLTVL